MTERSVAVASYLSGLPDEAWYDLPGLAGDLLARFPDLPRAELERGIAISLEIARSRTAEDKTARQGTIVRALAETGIDGAAALIAAEWDRHTATAIRARPAS